MDLQFTAKIGKRFIKKPFRDKFPRKLKKAVQKSWVIFGGHFYFEPDQSTRYGRKVKALTRVFSDGSIIVPFINGSFIKINK